MSMTYEVRLGREHDGYMTFRSTHQADHDRSCFPELWYRAEQRAAGV